MSDPAFFGYGSLVNLATHDYADPRPARLAGWRRVWCGTTLRGLAYLSVEEAPGVEIDGVIARVPRADWAALDEREAAYDRVAVTEAVRHDGPPSPIAVYRVSPVHLHSDRSQPILRSYLDVVVEGFWRMHGEAGVARFFETTGGWAHPVLDDRAAPVYPRARVVGAEVSEMVEAGLAGRAKG